MDGARGAAALQRGRRRGRAGVGARRRVGVRGGGAGALAVGALARRRRRRPTPRVVRVVVRQVRAGQSAVTRTVRSHGMRRCVTEAVCVRHVCDACRARYLWNERVGQGCTACTRDLAVAAVAGRAVRGLKIGPARERRRRLVVCAASCPTHGVLSGVRACVLPTGARAGSEDKEVRIWDLRCAGTSPRLLHALPVAGNSRAVVAVCGGEVVCAAAGRELFVWR